MSDISQYFFSGLSVGCIYAVVALGLVIVANVTGVYNFATGEYVMLGGMVTAVTSTAGWSLPLATLTAMVVVAAVAVLQERLTVAPVRGKIGPLGLVIASLGVGVMIRGAALLIWKEDPRTAQPYEGGIFHFLGADLANQVKWVYLATGLALVGFTLLFTHTSLGRAMRACAINPVAARLTGIRLGTMSVAAFALSGALCGLIAAVSASQVLVKWDAGITIGLVGFIAAALAGFQSPARAVLAGLALGVLEALAAGLISADYRQAIVYATLIVYLVGRDLYGENGFIRRAIKSRTASAAGSVDAPELRQEIQERVHAVEAYVRSHSQLEDERPGFVQRHVTRFRTEPKAWLVLLPPIFFVLAWLWPSSTSDVGSLDTGVFILLGAMTATGLGLVMGLASQFSLGQAAFVLLSGYTAAILTADHGWNPMAALVVAVIASVVIGTIVGWLTLRLEGLNLALATLAILVIMLVFVAQQESVTHGNQGVQGVSGLDIFGWKIIEPGSYFRFCLVVLAAILLLTRNIWYSRMGRTLKAIGIDREAAESIGLSAWTLKLRIFVLSSFFAGIAGVLWTYYLQYASPDSWDVNLAINLVTYVIVGGVLSPYGGLIGAVVVGYLQYYFRQHVGSSTGGTSSTWEVFLSGALIVFFVLVFRDGLAAIPSRIIDGVQRQLGRSRRTVAVATPSGPALAAEAAITPAGGIAALPTNGNGTRLEPLRDEKPLVVVDGLTKRFGNLIAVNDLSFALRPGYVTALIGPNGAGKSTVINMLSGTQLPTSGAVGLMGRPVVGLQPREIAELGLARTFQTPRLFEGMTLLETVMLARDRYGSRFWMIGGALRTPRARRDERESREQALSWLAYVGLAEDADVPATSLPVGKQRMAEVARALAAEPTVLLLDEPAAGLDGAETRAMGQLIRTLGDAGMAVLLVEHDMGMVMSIADHLVVIEEGKKISEGTPHEVGNDETVVNAYLGVVHA
jgi:branched-chain amino acid transport system permease protein